MQRTYRIMRKYVPPAVAGGGVETSDEGGETHEGTKDFTVSFVPFASLSNLLAENSRNTLHPATSNGRQRLERLEHFRVRHASAEIGPAIRL